MGGPTRPIGRPAFAIDRKRVSPNPSSVRGQLADPHATALSIGSAWEFTLRDFRALGADGSIEAPLVKKEYGVWALACRPIQGAGTRDWLMVVRSGPNAGEEGFNEAKSVD